MAPLLPSALTPSPAAAAAAPGAPLPPQQQPVPVPLGQLHVSWRRTHRRAARAQPQGGAPPAPPGAQGEGGEGDLPALDLDALSLQHPQPSAKVGAKRLLHAAPQRVLNGESQRWPEGSGTRTPAFAGGGVAEQVTTTLELPAVTVHEGLVAVRTLSPPQATAGIAFTFTLQVRRGGGPRVGRSRRGGGPRGHPGACPLPTCGPLWRDCRRCKATAARTWTLWWRCWMPRALCCRATARSRCGGGGGSARCIFPP